MNKALFADSHAGSKAKVKETDTENRAGGKAYKLDVRTAAAVFAMTASFPNKQATHQLSGEEQLQMYLELLNQCEPDFVAKLAVYSRQKGKMKDAPLLAVMKLLRDDDPRARHVAEIVFNQVVDTPVQYRNAVAVATSGVLGKKNLSHRQMKVLNERLFSLGMDYLASRGLTGSKPSLGLCIRLSHPDPKTQGKDQAAWENFFKYVLGRDDVNFDLLPKSIQEFETFKKDPEGSEIPKGIEILQVMGMLPKHSPKAWGKLAKRMSWTQLFKNLATLNRHGAFEYKETVQYVAERLSDVESVQKSRQFAYAIFNAHKHLADAGDIPFDIMEALADALDASIQMTPKLEGQVVVGVDTSGSMTFSNVMGGRGAMILDVAALFAASALKLNPKALIIPFDTSVWDAGITHRDSVATSAKTLANRGGGGTDLSVVFQETLRRVEKDKKFRPDSIIILSDMQTWIEGKGLDDSWGRGGTASNELFKAIQDVSGKKVKLVCWDLSAGETTQATGNDVLNIGGFSESLWGTVADFLSDKKVTKSADKDSDAQTWIKEIESIEL